MRAEMAIRNHAAVTSVSVSGCLRAGLRIACGVTLGGLVLGCAGQPARQVSLPENPRYLEILADEVSGAPGLGPLQDRLMRDDDIELRVWSSISVWTQGVQLRRERGLWTANWVRIAPCGLPIHPRVARFEEGNSQSRTTGKHWSDCVEPETGAPQNDQNQIGRDQHHGRISTTPYNADLDALWSELDSLGVTTLPEEKPSCWTQSEYGLCRIVIDSWLLAFELRQGGVYRASEFSDEGEPGALEKQLARIVSVLHERLGVLHPMTAGD